MTIFRPFDLRWISTNWLSSLRILWRRELNPAGGKSNRKKKILLSSNRLCSAGNSGRFSLDERFYSIRKWLIERFSRRKKRFISTVKRFVCSRHRRRIVWLSERSKREISNDCFSIKSPMKGFKEKRCSSRDLGFGSFSQWKEGEAVCRVDASWNCVRRCAPWSDLVSAIDDVNVDVELMISAWTRRFFQWKNRFEKGRRNCFLFDFDPSSGETRHFHVEHRSHVDFWPNGKTKEKSQRRKRSRQFFFVEKTFFHEPRSSMILWIEFSH